MAFSLDIYLNWGYPLSVLLSVALGYLWYGPLFHETWLEYSNFSRRSMARWSKCQYSNIAMVQCLSAQTVVSFIFMVTVVQYLVHVVGCSTAVEGCHLGATLFVGFAVPLSIVRYINDPRANQIVLLIDMTFGLAYFVMQSAVLAHFA